MTAPTGPRRPGRDGHGAGRGVVSCPTCGGPRATVGDVEALLVRVLVAALKEIARGLLPHRLRRSTAVRNPVYER